MIVPRWQMFGVLCLAATCPSLPAQTMSDAPGLVSIRFRQFGIEHGLSQVTARAIAQDGDGMIWIGTQDGLNRFDGEDMRVFRRDAGDSTSLNDNHVTALATDARGRLWVGTQSGGLGRYDSERLRFLNHPVSPGQAGSLAALPVHAIAQDREGRLWVASGRGHLQRLDPDTGRFDDVAIAPDLQVRALLPLPDGAVLVGTSRGVWQYRVATGALEPFAHALGSQPPDVQALARDSEGNLWVGSAQQGVFQLAPDGTLRRALRRADGLAGDDVRALLVDRSARVWIGTYTGLSRVDAPGAAPRSWGRESTRRDGLASERIHALIEDRDGLVWIGTWLGGVHLYAPASDAFLEFRTQTGEARALPGNAVRCIHYDSGHSLWLGVQEGGGLVEFDPGYGVRRRFLPRADDPDALASERVQALARDRDGALWIGFVDAGLDRLAPGTERFEHFRADASDPARPQGDNVLELHVDRGGTLWIGYQDAGLDSRCRGCDGFTRWRHDPADPHGLPGDTIGVVFETSGGELWVGARPGGLARLDRATGRFTRLEALLPAPGESLPRSITTVTESRRGDLWIGTQGSGIVRLERQGEDRFRATAYTHKQGLAAEAIGSILEDAQGAMWASTTQGISRIDPASGRIENFSVSSGAQSDGYFVDAGVALPDGHLAFGGLRGITLFQPGRIGARGRPHPPRLSSIRVFEARAADAGPGWRFHNGGPDGVDRIELPAGSGGFGVTFSALAFADPELVQYRYRLDPIDPEWIDAGPQLRSAGYPHLAPGDYLLRLSARYPGEDDSPERRVEISLAPLWWQTGWARGALALAICAALALWSWNRRLRALERQRAQAWLAESEQRLKLALWGTGDEFWDADLRSGKLVRVNPLGHLRVTHEARQESLQGFTPFLHPEDAPVFGEALTAHLKGLTDAIDVTYRAQDLDHQWRWMRSRGRVVERDARMRAVRMAGITSDITELKEYERTLQRINQALEERVTERTADLTALNRDLVRTIEQLRLTQHQLVESEKLAALGGLVAGIAHEINTPIGVGVTAASHLDQVARDFEQALASGQVDRERIESFRAVALECSAIVLRNLQRADRMIRSFKQVAVDQASEQPRRIDLRAYVDEILVSLQPTLKRVRHRIHVDVPSGLMVHTHPGALYQIVTNLLMNSLTHAFEGRESGNIILGARLESGHLVLDYADDGSGMPDDIRRRIFEPFFTTRRGQGGSGLGMHIVYNLATQLLGGSIECDSSPGEGTRFVVRIPVRE